MKKLTQYDTYEVAVDEIFFDITFNCRGNFTPQSVHVLAKSIKANGLQFPVVVEPYDKDGYKYRLIAGHRRFRAVTVFLKWVTIPANVRMGLTGHEARLLNLSENLDRQDLNILEEAQAINKLYPKTTSLRKVAKDLNQPTRWVHARRRLLDLPPLVQKFAAAGFISAINIEVLHKMDTPRKQIQAAQEIAQHRKQYGRLGSVASTKYQRTFRYRKTKKQMANMIAHLYHVGCEGLAARILAWAAGKITDKEIEADIKSEPAYQRPGQNYRLPYRKKS